MSDKRGAGYLTEVEKEKQLYESYTKKQKHDERREIEKRNNNESSGSIKESTNEPEWEDRRGKEISYEELKPLIITRDFLAANVYKPFFNFFKGNIVRVSFPNGYAICKVLDIKYGKEYSYPFGKYFFRTDKYLVVKHGDNKLDIPISHISNSPLKQDEYNVQRKSELQASILSDYARTRKLMDRKMNKDEQKKFEDEKRNFMCDFSRRKSYYKTDIVRKRKDAVNERKPELAKELLEVLYKFNDDEEPLTDIQVNEYARKYNLRVPGGEVEIEPVRIKHEK